MTIASAMLPLAVLMGFQAQKAALPGDPQVAAFRKSTVASVSDAVDQITGKRGFMSHDMRPQITGHYQAVGRARTAYVKKAPASQSTPQTAVKHSVAMIDDGKPGEVGVIVMEDGLDVAVLGGLMATAAKSRGMAGIIADGGLRDLAEIRALGLSVFARSVVPSTAVSRYVTVFMDQEVTCAGIKVSPGDIIVAGEDGVVVVPKDRAAEVLKRSQEIDDRETKMVPFIKQFRSLTKAIEKFNRI
ncbi:MAG TPA: RraA family protein [Bryobacteraceae bacterium]|nr:RraA family protein [Bryobacteraceae bacterium]